MDLTPQVINEVEFSMARKGYDPDQVDEFLEKVAVAVGGLNDRLGELRERVLAAERRAQEAERRASETPERVVEVSSQAQAQAAAVSAAAEAELETLKRTLLLAQRTADAAVREAEEEARRMLEEAQHQARTAHETTRREVLEEIASLEAMREVLRTDIEGLELHIEGQRNRLQGAIGDLQRILEQNLPAPPARAAAADEVPPATVETELEPEAQPEPPEFVLADDERDDDAWARFSPPAEELDAGPRTEPVLRLDRIERGSDAGDDAYLAELRKAMLDDTGAPDASELGFFDDPNDNRSNRSTRFGRRR